jgi:hypothetical protein
VVRRLEAGLKPHLKALEQDPEPRTSRWRDCWRGGAGDELGDRFAAWAVARDPALRPGTEVDELVDALDEELDVLGVARDRNRPSPGPGGRPRRRPAKGV